MDDLSETEAETGDAVETPDVDPAVQQMRALLAVAAVLRKLSSDAPTNEASLYLAAAGSLARRAARMAGLLPDADGTPQAPPSALHRPVDLHV